MNKISYEVILIIELVGSILLLLSFYLYYKSLPDFFVVIDGKGCSGSVWGMIHDWFYQGIRFLNYNNCYNPSFISKNFAYIFWLGWIGEIIGSYLHIRYIFRKK